MQLEVGIAYTNRGKQRIVIIAEMTPDDYGYIAGFRYHGVHQPADDRGRFDSTIKLYREDGKAFGTDQSLMSTPGDLIGLYRETPELISIDAVRKGQIIGEVHGGHVIEGIAKGWDLSNAFPIDSESFDAIVGQVCSKEERVLEDNELVLISTIEGGDILSNHIGSMLVAYHINYIYHIGMLFLPEDFLDSLNKRR